MNLFVQKMIYRENKSLILHFINHVVNLHTPRFLLLIKYYTNSYSTYNKHKTYQSKPLMDATCTIYFDKYHD